MVLINDDDNDDHTVGVSERLSFLCNACPSTTILTKWKHVESITKFTLPTVHMGYFEYYSQYDLPS